MTEPEVRIELDTTKLNEALDRVLGEVRSQDRLLKAIRDVLSGYGDLDRLSLQGAVEALVRRSKVLDEVCHCLAVRTKNPDEAHLALLRLDEIVKKIR